MEEQRRKPCDYAMYMQAGLQILLYCIEEQEAKIKTKIYWSLFTLAR